MKLVSLALCIFLLLPLLSQADGVTIDSSGVVFSIDMKTLLRYSNDRDEMSYEIPDTVEIIASRAFEGSRLEQISFPNIWTYGKEMVIEDRAFKDCMKLQYIYLPYYISFIGDDMFSGCPDELPVVIGDQTAAHQYLQEYLTGPAIDIQWVYSELQMSSWEMASVNLNHYPKEITWGDYHVYEHVLFFHSDLVAYPSKDTANSYTLPEFVHAVKTGSLISPSMKRLRINKTCTSIEPQSQYEEGALETVEVDGDSRYFTSIEGVLYSFPSTRLHLYPAEREIEVYEVPKGVLSLEDECFANSRIKQIILPEGLKAIGYNVFWNSQVEEINIPASVDDMDISAFEYCPNLEKIHLTADSEAYEVFEINREYIDFSDIFVFPDEVLETEL